MMSTDPYDYPRCEICTYCAGPNRCTYPGEVTMSYAHMVPAGHYDSYCDKYKSDSQALVRVHKLARSPT